MDLTTLERLVVRNVDESDIFGVVGPSLRSLDVRGHRVTAGTTCPHLEDLAVPAETTLPELPSLVDLELRGKNPTTFTTKVPAGTLTLRNVDLFVPVVAFKDFAQQQAARKSRATADFENIIRCASGCRTLILVFADAFAADATFADVDDYDDHLTDIARAAPGLAAKYNVDLVCDLSRSPPPASHRSRRFRSSSSSLADDDAAFDPIADDHDTIPLSAWLHRARQYHNVSSGDVIHKGCRPWEGCVASNIFSVYARPPPP